MITLVLGGTRSGKSVVAERLASALPQPVTYVATLQLGEDEELAERVATHRDRRPATWRTEEAGKDLPLLLRTLTGTVLLDSLGGWVAGLQGDAEAENLCTSLTARTGDTVVVSEEVGMGVHAMTETGRHFSDALGSLNQAVAQVADECLLVVAGKALHLETP